MGGVEECIVYINKSENLPWLTIMANQNIMINS
jgi:hypothetical protein